MSAKSSDAIIYKSEANNEWSAHQALIPLSKMIRGDHVRQRTGKQSHPYLVVKVRFRQIKVERKEAV